MPREPGSFPTGESPFNRYGGSSGVPGEPAQVNRPPDTDHTGDGAPGRIAHVTPLAPEISHPSSPITHPVYTAAPERPGIGISRRAVAAFRKRFGRSRTKGDVEQQTQDPAVARPKTTFTAGPEGTLTVDNEPRRVDPQIEPLTFREAVQTRGPLEPLMHTPAFRNEGDFAEAWVGFGYRVQAAPLVTDKHPAAAGMREDAGKDSINRVTHQAEHLLGREWLKQARDAVRGGEPTFEQLYAVTTAVHPDPAIQKLSIPDQTIRHPDDRARENLSAIRAYGQLRLPHTPLSYTRNENNLARLIAERDLRTEVLDAADDDPTIKAAADIRFARSVITPGNKKAKHAVSWLPLPPELEVPFREAQRTYFTINPEGQDDNQQIKFGNRPVDQRAAIMPPPPSPHKRASRHSSPHEGSGGRADKLVRLERARTRLDDLPGLRGPKEEIIKACVGVRYPHIWDKWGAPKRQRILLEGPEGNGKTSLVHGAADFLGVPIARISASHIVNMFQGETPKNLQAVFDKLQARASGLVVYFSEFEQLAGLAIDSPKDSSDHEHNARISIFKTGLDSLDNPHLLIIADTNNSERLDPAVIRDGRFDTRIIIGNPTEAEAAEIFAELMGKPNPGSSDDDILTKLDPDNVTNTAALRARLMQLDKGGKRAATFHLKERWQFANDVDPVSLARLSRQGTEAGRSRAFLPTVVERALSAKAFEEATTGVEPSPITQMELENLVLSMLRNGH